MNTYNKQSLDQSLELAVVIEEDLIRQYREWALRFLPYDPSISCTLEELCVDMEKDKGDLLFYASRLLDFKKRLKSPPVKLNHPRPEHFFILGSEVAASLLDLAVQLKKEALKFYRQERDGSPLSKLYQELAELHAVHIQILHEMQRYMRYRPRPSSTRSFQQRQPVAGRAADLCPVL